MTNSTTIKQQLEEIDALLNKAFMHSPSVPEGLTEFITFLEESNNNPLAKNIIPEVKRYLSLLISQDLFDMIRTSIDDLRKNFIEILPKHVRVTFLSRRKSVQSAIRKICLHSLMEKPLTLNDIFAFRIIIDSTGTEEQNIEYCYIAKNFCIQYFKNRRRCRLTKLKDYIAEPKSNNYQSIHLIFDFISNNEEISKVNPSFEIQIRTMDMDIEDDYGTASHVAFKEEQYKSVKKIKININHINLPNFRVVHLKEGEKNKTVIVDHIGLVEALHVEERNKSF